MLSMFKKRMLTFFYLLLVTLISTRAVGFNFLQSAQYLFFTPGDNTRVNIELEYLSQNLSQTTEIITHALGGTFTQSTSHNNTIVHINNTSVGNLVLINHNGLIQLYAKGKTEAQVLQLQQAVSQLARESTSLINTRVWVEMGEGVRDQIRVSEVLTLLRNYFNPENFSQINSDLAIPESRKWLARPCSFGFTSKLADQNYNPSWQELYNDYVVRQTLELLGDSNAWTLDINVAKEKITSITNQSQLLKLEQIISSSGLQVTALMLWLFPEDPISIKLTESRLVTAEPAILFQGWNASFDIDSPVRQALGTVEVSLSGKPFHHDIKVSKMLNMTHQGLVKFRARLDTMSPFERSLALDQASLLFRMKSESIALKRFVDANSGEPVALTKGAFPHSTYVKIEARQLSQAKVLWVNREYLLKVYGIHVPENGPTPEQSAAMLSAWGYRIPHENDPDYAYDWTKPSKNLYASRMGGYGLNGNFGAGRAAEFGESEIKGSGQTPLVGPGTNNYYKRGGGKAYVTEGIREAINSKILQDGPNRSNEVIAVIDTGMGTSLIVRNSDVRLGHISPRANHDEEGDLHPDTRWHHDSEMTRARDLLEQGSALNVLPIPPEANQFPPRKRYIAGIKELARRFGQQVGFAFANGIYHGTDSASNILLTGGFIDLGSNSYHPNHAPLKLLHDAAPGGVHEVLSLIWNFVGIERGATFDLAPRQSAGDDELLPTIDELNKIGIDAYDHQLRIEFLKMVGLPEKLAVLAEKSEQGKKLATSLISIAQDEAGLMLIKDYTPSQMTRYDIRPLIMDLALIADQSEEILVHTLSKHMANRGGKHSNPVYWSEVASQYHALMKSMQEIAFADGIKPTAFWKLVKIRSNYARKRWDIHHDALGRFSDELTSNYFSGTISSSDIQRAMDAKIIHNRLSFHGFASYEAVLDLTEKDDLQIYKVYDAKKGHEIGIVRAPISAGGNVNIKGQKYELDQILMVSQLSVSNKTSGKVSLSDLAQLIDQLVEFRFNSAIDWSPQDDFAIQFANSQNNKLSIKLEQDISKSEVNIRSCKSIFN